MNSLDFNSFFRKYKKYFVIIVAMIAILIGLTLIVLVGEEQLARGSYEKEARITDSNYSKQYEAIIKPEGAKRLNSILNTVDKIDDPREKLNTIAEWEIQNFTSYYWGAEFPEPDNLHRYYIYSNGKTRAYTNNLGMNSPYKDDPYWMAYEKAGECEEKAALFKTVADRAGFTTQGVGYPGLHAWVEIKNTSTGEWLYFDPDCYHQYLGDPLNSTLWYNQTKYYRINCLNFDSSVIVDKTNEDKTKAYKVPEPQKNSFQKGYLGLPVIDVKFSRGR
jgi:hypothetical protein